MTAKANGSGGSGVAGPGSSTNNYVPQWSGTGGGTLAAGLPVGTTGANTILETGSGGKIDASVLPSGVGGGGGAPSWVAGRWYTPIVPSASFSPLAAEMYCLGLYVPNTVTIDKLAVVAGGAVNQSIAMALYAGNYLAPGSALLVNGTSVSGATGSITSGTAVSMSLSTPVQITAGEYLACANVSATGALYGSVETVGTAPNIPLLQSGFSVPLGATGAQNVTYPPGGRYAYPYTGSMPANLGGLTANAVNVLVSVSVYSVP